MADERWPMAAADRDRYVLDMRPARPVHDPWRYQDVLVEEERTADGRVASVATVFLTGRECPWRCAMCDLWRYTTEADTPRGAIPAQVRAARHALSARSVQPSHMKLYNAGSFFDPRAVPEDDYPEVARLLDGLERVTVETHPALVGARVEHFLAALERTRGPIGATVSVEVAMGLETAHPEALERLHKRMTVETFAAAADRLHALGVALRVFLLVSPPFIPRGEQDDWLRRSLDAAIECRASVVSLVPTRPGNGALDAIAADGLFDAPRLADVERSARAALTHAAGRVLVFADLWDLERVSDCQECYPRRRARLHQMNLEQRILPEIACDACGVGIGA